MCYFLNGVRVNGVYYTNSTIYLTTAGLYTIVPAYVLQYYLTVYPSPSKPKYVRDSGVWVV